MAASLGYGIFRRLEDGAALWVDDAATLDEARKKLDALAVTKPAQYIVRDAETGKIVDDDNLTNSGGTRT
jgi:hypothetical protein